MLSCTVKSGFEPEGAARALRHGAFRHSRIIPRDGLELALDPTYQLITLSLVLFLSVLLHKVRSPVHLLNLAIELPGLAGNVGRLISKILDVE